jgi:hypothetical protein
MSTRQRTVSGGFGSACSINCARHLTGVLLTLDCHFPTLVERP